MQTHPKSGSSFEGFVPASLSFSLTPSACFRCCWVRSARVSAPPRWWWRSWKPVPVFRTRCSSWRRYSRTGESVETSSQIRSSYDSNPSLKSFPSENQTNTHWFNNQIGNSNTSLLIKWIALSTQRTFKIQSHIDLDFGRFFLVQWSQPFRIGSVCWSGAEGQHVLLSVKSCLFCQSPPAPRPCAVPGTVLRGHSLSAGHGVLPSGEAQK